MFIFTVASPIVSAVIGGGIRNLNRSRRGRCTAFAWFAGRFVGSGRWAGEVFAELHGQLMSFSFS